ncbi:hypothetical protein BRC62_02625 [Halobacteriales archaeon QH_10_67_13]|nr:MAG: hypothetical protein BRC62_02625 [Halobacteriales archaeon QH_10_67_13]
MSGSDDAVDAPDPRPQWPDGDTEDARETPVEDGCLLCKRRAEPSERVELETGEYLCDACHGDLREFDRSVHAQLWVSEKLGRTRRILLDDWSEAVTDLSEDRRYADALPRRRSNADEYRFPE